MNSKHNGGNQTIGHELYHESAGNQNPEHENAVVVLAYKERGGTRNGKKIVGTTVH
jgi:hypothetical protein